MCSLKILFIHFKWRIKKKKKPKLIETQRMSHSTTEKEAQSSQYLCKCSHLQMTI